MLPSSAFMLCAMFLMGHENQMLAELQSCRDGLHPVGPIGSVFVSNFLTEEADVLAERKALLVD